MGLRHTRVRVNGQRVRAERSGRAAPPLTGGGTRPVELFCGQSRHALRFHLHLMFACLASQGVARWKSRGEHPPYFRGAGHKMEVHSPPRVAPFDGATRGGEWYQRCGPEPHQLGSVNCTARFRLSFRWWCPVTARVPIVGVGVLGEILWQTAWEGKPPGEPSEPRHSCRAGCYPRCPRGMNVAARTELRSPIE